MPSKSSPNRILRAPVGVPTAFLAPSTAQSLVTRPRSLAVPTAPRQATAVQPAPNTASSGTATRPRTMARSTAGCGCAPKGSNAHAGCSCASSPPRPSPNPARAQVPGQPQSGRRAIQIAGIAAARAHGPGTLGRAQSLRDAMRTDPARTLGGVVCDIPWWIRDCLRNAIFNFNVAFPPLVADFRRESRGGTPDEYGEQMTRVQVWEGRRPDLGPSLLAYADCADHVLDQLYDMAESFGPTGEFEKFVGEATGAEIYFSYRFVDGSEQTVNTFVYGILAEQVPTQYVSTSGMCSGAVERAVTPSPRRGDRPPPRFLTAPPGRISRTGTEILQFRGFNGCPPPTTRVCELAPLSAYEVDTLEAAYNRARDVVPPREARDPVERARVNRQWLDEFFGWYPPRSPPLYWGPVWEIVFRFWDGTSAHGFEILTDTLDVLSRENWTYGDFPFENFLDVRVSVRVCGCAAV